MLPNLFKQKGRVSKWLATSVLAYGQFALAQSETDNTPIATQETIQADSLTDAASVFSQHPEILPGTTEFSNSGRAPSIDIRGLDPFRTSVMLEGRSVIDGLGDGVPSLGVIPIGLVDQVSLDTSGTLVSPYAGIGGTVDVRLDRTFSGKLFRVIAEGTEHGDAETYFAQAKIGGQLGTDNLHGVLYVDYTNQKAVFREARESTANDLRDNGTTLVPFLSSVTPSGILRVGVDFAQLPQYDINNCPEGSTLTVTGGSSACYASAVTFDSNGNPLPFISEGPNSQRYNAASEAYLRQPLERVSIASLMEFDGIENTRLKTTLLWSLDQSATQFSAHPFDSAINVLVLNHPFLSAFNSSGIYGDNRLDHASFDRRITEAGPRHNATEYENLWIGLDLETDFLNSWTSSLQGHFAQQLGTFEKSGFLSDDDLFVYTGVNASPNIFQCNVFGPNTFSDECLALTHMDFDERYSAKQFNFSAELKGPVTGIKSPLSGAPLTVSVSADVTRRKQQTGPAFTLNTSDAPVTTFLSGEKDTLNLGVKAVLPIVSRGDQDVISAAGWVNYTNFQSEGLVHIGATSGFVLGRFRDLTPIYEPAKSTSKSDWTYGGSAEWTPSSSLTARASFARQARIPSLEELFGAAQTQFNVGSDPCFAGSANVALCAASGIDAQYVGTSFITPHPIVRGIVGGNPDLEAETADTLSLGINWVPSFSPESRIEVSYVNTDINRRIQELGAQTILNLCLESGASELCPRIGRIGLGSLQQVDTRLANFGSINSETVNVLGRHSHILGEGSARLRLNFKGSLALSQNRDAYFTDISPFEIKQFQMQCTGVHNSRFGPSACDSLKPKWRHTANIGYSQDGWDSNVSWRYISSTDLNRFNQNGTPVLIASVNKIKAQSYIDASVSRKIGSDIELQFSVSNLLNKAPPLVGLAHAERVNTFPGHYDTLGRRFSVSAKWTLD